MIVKRKRELLSVKTLVPLYKKLFFAQSTSYLASMV